MYIYMYMYQFRNGFWKTLYGTHTGCFRYQEALYGIHTFATRGMISLSLLTRYRNDFHGSLIRNTHFRYSPPFGC